MKIAIVTDAIWPFTIGGSEIRNHEIGKRLVKRGHEVHIYGAKLWPEKERIKIIDGVIIHGVAEYKQLYDKSGKRRKFDSLKLAFLMFFSIMKSKCEIYDVAAFSFFNVYATWLACLLKKRPMVLTWHQYLGNYLIQYLGKRVGKQMMLLEKLSLKLTNENIAVSEDVKNTLISNGLLKEKVKVIPNGIDFESIQNTHPADEKSDIIFVGRLHFQKNIDLLIDIISKLVKIKPKLRCFIIGDGPEKNRLINKTRALKINGNIFFLGEIKNKKIIYSFMKSSKLMVITSRIEGAPLVIKEAELCNLNTMIIKPENLSQVVLDKIIEEINIRTNNTSNKKKDLIKFDWDYITMDSEKYYKTIQQ